VSRKQPRGAERNWSERKIEELKLCRQCASTNDRAADDDEYQLHLPCSWPRPGDRMSAVDCTTRDPIASLELIGGNGEPFASRKKEEIED
jgi:hypothetical protein